MSNSINQLHSRNVRKPRQRNTNNSNQIHINEFVSDIRSHLIIVETENVEIRCKEFENIINTQTQNVNTAIFGRNTNTNQHTIFRYSIDNDKMKQFLSYIYEWNGLKTSQNIAKTKKEYQKKSRNWLNGRRKKKYGNTLFVDMLKHCRNYAEYVSSIYFGNKNKTEVKNKKLYYQLLLYSFLSQICAKNITLKNSARKTYLICDHAIIASTETKQLMQQFANKYDSKSFPCHRDEAIDYFKKQCKATLTTLRSKFDQTIIENKTHQQYESFITDLINNKTVNSDGMTISIEMNKFCTLLHIIDDLQAKQVQSENMINLLNDKIHQLENKKNVYVDGSNVIRDKCPISMNLTNYDPFYNYHNSNHQMHIDHYNYCSIEPAAEIDFNTDFISCFDEQEYYSQFNSL